MQVPVRLCLAAFICMVVGEIISNKCMVRIIKFGRGVLGRDILIQNEQGTSTENFSACCGRLIEKTPVWLCLGAG